MRSARYYWLPLLCTLVWPTLLYGQNQTDAFIEYLNGNDNTVISICVREIAQNPTQMDSYVVICWSLIRLNRYEEARIYADTGRTLSRYDVRVIEILGEISYYEGQNTEALSYFQEYITLAPEGQRIDTVYYLIGEVYIRQGRFRHADIALSMAVYYVPGNARWWTRLAWARENAGELTQAAAAYERALTLNALFADAQRGLSRVRAALGQR
jgi:tetratricopeptide (TPR) repeat protein